MTVLDTSTVIERVKGSEPISENTTVITLIEYPPLFEYSKFTGDVLYPAPEDFSEAIELQRRLRKFGMTKGASDLIIATICIRNKEGLITNDGDFKDITKISALRLQ
jgi:predicted nucleic acid-binding protein